jgi:hypothetical protein
MFDRQILHVLKDSDLFLNKWFRKKNLGYAKSLKKYGHMKVQVQKNDDEHMKAHVLKKRNKEKDSHVSTH